MTEVFRPVGSVADLRRRAEDAAHIGPRIAKGLHGRIAGSNRADGHQPAHLRADQESIDTPGRRTEMGVIQDHLSQAPVTGSAGPADGLARDREVDGRGGAEKARNLHGGRGRLVHAAREPARGRTGNPAAPWEHGLARLGGVVAVWARQRVPRPDVH